MENYTIDEKSMLQILKGVESFLSSPKKNTYPEIARYTDIEHKYWRKLIDHGLVKRTGTTNKPIYEWDSIHPNIYMAVEILKDVSDFTKIVGFTKLPVKDKTKNKNVSQQYIDLVAEIDRNGFLPPTINEVAVYCHSRNNGIDPEKFIMYYAQNGWMVGKKKMKNWRMAIHTWEQNNKKPITYNVVDKKLTEYTIEELTAEIKKRGGKGTISFKTDVIL